MTGLEDFSPTPPCAASCQTRCHLADTGVGLVRDEEVARGIHRCSGRVVQLRRDCQAPVAAEASSAIACHGGNVTRRCEHGAAERQNEGRHCSEAESPPVTMKFLDTLSHLFPLYIDPDRFFGHPKGTRVSPTKTRVPKQAPYAAELFGSGTNYRLGRRCRENDACH